MAEMDPSAQAGERSLAAAETRFRQLFESAPIGMFVTNVEATIVDINQTSVELVGRSREELLGSSMLDLTHPDDIAESREHLRRLFRGEITSYRLEKRYVHSLGHTVWAQLDVILLEPAEAHMGPQALCQVQDITVRRRQQAQLEHLVDHDALTGLLNRRGMSRELERHTDLVCRYGPEGALLVIDLDHFKEVNDTLGHNAGDALIMEVAGLIRKRVRTSDLVARLGGDEFAVLLPRGAAKDAETVARALVEMFRARPPVQGSDLRVTASVGVVAFGERADADKTLICADQAMYDAKRSGRDGFAVYRLSESLTGARVGC
jgi:diguanylate cyclase (GGDEF)-like protein/PAS domain S-box-containing protein